VFDSEPAAFEGLTALKGLHRDGDITLYASTVIAKDASGTVAVRQAADDGPVGTLAGVVTGGLVGLLGGPVGVAVGAYVGGLGGLMYDLLNVGIGADFLDEVGGSLTPGKAAIVADVDETWATPVDTRLGALGGTTFRRLQGEIVDAELIRETDAARAELEELQAEVRKSSGEAKAKLEAAIEAQGRKLEAMDERIGRAIDQQEAEFEARLATLREQAAKSRESQRQRIDARIDALKASHEARKTKLADARRLAKASIETTREALVG
jgi:uncharacterized membrane protein